MTTGETLFIVFAVIAILLAVVFLPQINGLGSYKPVAKKSKHKKREDDILEEPEQGYNTYQPPTTSQIQSRDTSQKSSATFRKRVNDRLNDVAPESAPVTFRPVVKKPVSQPRSSGHGIARHVDENFDLDEFWQKEAENDVRDSQKEELRRQKEELEKVDFHRNEDNV